MINIKTQTSRSTTMIYDRLNVNLFVDDFEFAIVTSKYWDDYTQRKDPLIQIKLEGGTMEMTLSEFKEVINKLKEVRDDI